MSLLLRKRQMVVAGVSPSVRYAAGKEANTGTSITVIFPGAPIAGDVIVFMYGCSTSGGPTTVPTGFTLDHTTITDLPDIRIYSKVAEGTEGSSFTFGDASNNKKSAVGWIVKDWAGVLRQVRNVQTSGSVNTGTIRWPSGDDVFAYQGRTLILVADCVETGKFFTWSIRITSGFPLVTGSIVQSAAPANFMNGISYTVVESGSHQIECTLNSGGQHQGYLYILRN
jgi:hypothetical protein